MEIGFAGANEPDLMAVKASVNSITNIFDGIFHAVKIKKKVFLGCHLEAFLLEGSALRALWLPEKGSNLRHPGPKPGVLPLNYLAKVLNGWRHDIGHSCGSKISCLIAAANCLRCALWYSSYWFEKIYSFFLFF